MADENNSSDKRRGGGWFTGFIAALAVLAIVYLVFSDNPMKRPSPSAITVPPPTVTTTN